MVSFTINEKFSDLRDLVLNLPVNFHQIGSVIQDNRNVIKRINTEKGTVIVKDFRGMYFFNRLAYSLFRKSKAERSFLYSVMLNERDILTPPHVSYMDIYKWGFLTKSYFVSIYYPYKTLREFLKDNENNTKNRTSLYHHLAVFVKKLHDREVYHKDFSLGNILVIPNDKGFQFALVDLNRIKFRKVSYKEGLRNFNTLEISTGDMDTLLTEYSILSNQSAEESVKMFWKYKKRASSLRRIRKSIRRYTLTPLEKAIATISAEIQNIFAKETG